MIEIKLNNEELKKEVKNKYSKVATGDSSCCTTQNVSSSLGYSKEDLDNVPKDANLGLGCGNPISASNMQPGETVLDLGSGAGFDCFLASKKVGRKGKVIGVDMTHEMLEKSRENAKKGRYRNVDFRLGEIENLPVANDTVDVVISNCVINLSPRKQRVYDEIHRVLKVGGRICISDVILMRDLTQEMLDNSDLYCNWVTGASSVEEIENFLKKSGFKNIHVDLKELSQEYQEKWSTGLNVGEYIMSGMIHAEK